MPYNTTTSTQSNRNTRTERTIRYIDKDFTTFKDSLIYLLLKKKIGVIFSFKFNGIQNEIFIAIEEKAIEINQPR